MTTATPTIRHHGAAVRTRRSRMQDTAPLRRVWLFGLTLTLAGALLFTLEVADLPAHTRPFLMPWWALALAFYVTEINIVHVHFRRETQAFSINEVPLVLGLFFADPGQLVLAAVVGALTALVMSQRQAGIKLVVNISHVLLATTVAAWIFHSLLATPSGLQWRSWIVAALAAVVASLVNLSLIHI